MCIRNGALVIISRIKNLKKKLHSLHFYIFLIVMLCGLIPLVVMQAFSENNFYDSQVRRQMVELQNIGVNCASQVASSGFMTEQDLLMPIVRDIELIAELNDGRGQLIDAGYRVVLDTRSVDQGKYNISEAVIKCFDGQRYSYYSSDNQYIELTQPISDPRTSEIIGVLILSASTANLDVMMSSVEWKNQLVAWILVILLIAAAIVITGLLMRPFHHVRNAVAKACDGENSIVLRGDEFYELSEITGGFQTVLSRLTEVDQSRQEFVSNVSHELKTPITSIRVLADSLLGQEDVPVEIYREFMNDISEEIDREGKIISDLLALVKLDKSATEMNLEQVNINDFMESILKRLQPIAQKRNIELVFESFRPVTAEIDEVKLSLAISNLVENAIKYNMDDGWVRVSLNADHKFFFIKVADSGVGIPEDAAEHVFERFYRVDKARSRDTGGTGLGLAITKNVINLHHGAIRLYSRPGEGSTFTVRIPLTYIA